jgi:hypothetical protein
VTVPGFLFFRRQETLEVPASRKEVVQFLETWIDYEEHFRLPFLLSRRSVHYVGTVSESGFYLRLKQGVRHPIAHLVWAYGDLEESPQGTRIWISFESRAKNKLRNLVTMVSATVGILTLFMLWASVAYGPVMLLGLSLPLGVYLLSALSYEDLTDQLFATILDDLDRAVKTVEQQAESSVAEEMEVSEQTLEEESPSRKRAIKPKVRVSEGPQSTPKSDPDAIRAARRMHTDSSLFD